jgi:hypothetical protein
VPELLCARPHVKEVDFAASRFVVRNGRGIDLGRDGVVCHLEMGDEVPAGVLDEYALKCLYDATREIDTLDYAATVPYLREACARRGTIAAEPETKLDAERRERLRELELLSKKQMQDLCRRRGIRDDGPREKLRDRLAEIIME